MVKVCLNNIWYKDNPFLVYIPSSMEIIAKLLIKDSDTLNNKRWDSHKNDQLFESDLYIYFNMLLLLSPI